LIIRAPNVEKLARRGALSDPANIERDDVGGGHDQLVRYDRRGKLSHARSDTCVPGRTLPSIGSDARWLARAGPSRLWGSKDQYASTGNTSFGDAPDSMHIATTRAVSKDV